MAEYYPSSDEVVLTCLMYRVCDGFHWGFFKHDCGMYLIYVVTIDLKQEFGVDISRSRYLSLHTSLRSSLLEQLLWWLENESQ